MARFSISLVGGFWHPAHGEKGDDAAPSDCHRVSFNRPLGRGRRSCFARSEDGSVMVETIIILPVMLVFLVGILEFGALLYNKMQVETGLRDGARYLSRCNETLIQAGNCSAQEARNLAVFGNTAGTGAPRARGWTANSVSVEGWPTTDPSAGLRISTEFDYPGSPLMGFINIASIPVFAYHDERFLRW